MKIGLVLGSGSARGWAHIGVIRALEEAGVVPDIVCGCSIGALVGAAYASGNIDSLETWVRELDWWSIVRVMDPAIANGGFIGGDSLMKRFGEHLSVRNIEELPRTYAAVSTNLRTGEEVWLRSGPLLDAVRASIALPGLFTPVRVGEHWLVDGGLVNPVPVSLCRALGADVVIAVSLNGDIIGRHLEKYQSVQKEKRKESTAVWGQFLARLNLSAEENNFGGLVAKKEPPGPGLFDVVASSINIMQDGITRSRLATDPPDVLVTPRLARIGLMEFDRADEAIKEGRRAVEQALPQLAQLGVTRQRA
jgi:NTE family protein